MIYSLTKLLSEEPEKIELTILNFLKILVTIWFVSLFLEIKVDYKDLSEGIMPDNFGVTSVIKYVLIAIVIWYTIWWALSDILVGFIVFIFAKIGKDRSSFLMMVSGLGICEVKNDIIIKPEVGIVEFYEVLDSAHQEDEYPKLNDIRINIYFSLLLFLLIVISVSGMFHWAFIAIISFVLLNLFFGMVVITKILRYFKTDTRIILKEFGYWNHVQKIRNAINENDLGKEYKVEFKPKKIFLLPREQKETKEQKEFKSIEIFPEYHWNNKIGSSILMERLKTSNTENRFGGTTKKYGIVVSNLTENSNEDLNIDNPYFKVVHGRSKNDIYNRLAESIFEIKRHYTN